MTRELEPVRYYADSDMMAIEVRPWPGGPDDFPKAKMPRPTW